MKRLIGGILVAAGILVGGASGLCTLFVGLPLMASSDSEGFFAFGQLVAVCGGIPMLLGFGAYKWGRALIRQAEAAGPGEFD